MENPRNQNQIREKELLVVSFGTSFNDTRKRTICAVEQEMEDTFTDYSVRRGFTSQKIIRIIEKREHVRIDHVDDAICRAISNGVKELVIQPTHLMNGHEYHDLLAEATPYKEQFQSMVIGNPLLTSDEDFKAVVTVMTEETAEYDDGRTAICFMGHGTDAEANGVYGRLQQMFIEAGHENYYIGTVEAAPTIENLVKLVKTGDYERVILQPLMIAAGDHANNDMAGENEDSWKSVFEKEGYKVVCIMKGIGELEGIRRILVQHAQDAMNLIEAKQSGQVSLE